MDSRVRLIVRAVVLLALARPALAETESQTQTVIQGSGNDVSIVYRSSATGKPHVQYVPPARPAPTAPAAEQNIVLTEVAQMTGHGASDDSIINHLRIHQAGLPTVVSTEQIDQLRKAGVDRPVIAYLSRLTAVEIGETGEGAQVVTASAPEYDTGDLPWNSAAYAGGGYYGGGAFVGWGGGVGPRGRFVPHSHVAFHAVRSPAHFPRPLPVRSGHMAMGSGMPAHGASGGTRTR